MTIAAIASSTDAGFLVVHLRIHHYYGHRGDEFLLTYPAATHIRELAVFPCGGYISWWLSTCKSSRSLPTEVGRIMFILPALMNLKVLPLFGQCLYYFIVPNKSRPPHADAAALSLLVLSRLYTLLGLAGPVWAFLHHTSERAFNPYV
ncbi:hypothetical protein AVEN_138716-1 [Araneus ventricosus]|uniref:Uncharacterized protein n=1 Tax=Araneus ventricosus TaxID=182803 RepID=A0A4Y2QS54_ARAVE|nr:hypothetical protein AVEN_138716-1 [Araneus ventricosus]